MSVERLGIYGGTYSPPHNGHIRAAKAFLESAKLDRLLIMPTAEPPHKEAVKGASAGQRFEMLKLAFADFDERVEVSDFEQKRAGKSYTVYTLEAFTAPERELLLLVGTDMFLTLDRWYRARDIFALATIAFMRRESDSALDATITEKRELYKKEYGARILELDKEHIELSSTELRERIHAGKPLDDLLPASVADYIAANRLYLSSEEGN